MRFFKQHPALAALLVIAVIGVFAPVAYAIVDRVFLSIDTSKSEREIEEDVKEQLEAAGHPSATVKATKGDGTYEIEIGGDDPALGKLDLDIVAGGNTYKVHLDLPPTLTEAQGMAVGDAASKALQRPNNETDAQVEAQIRADLAKAGMKDVTLSVRELAVSITVR